jgi:hypothetical protein
MPSTHQGDLVVKMELEEEEVETGFQGSPPWWMEAQLSPAAAFEVKEEAHEPIDHEAHEPPNVPGSIQQVANPPNTGGSMLRRAFIPEGDEWYVFFLQK